MMPATLRTLKSKTTPHSYNSWRSWSRSSSINILPDIRAAEREPIRTAAQHPPARAMMFAEDTTSVPHWYHPTRLPPQPPHSVFERIKPESVATLQPCANTT